MSTNETTTTAAAKDTTMLVIFGRPGAGKSTVADAAINLLSIEERNLHCIGLDLDVCVPQWMRDNFARGIYPSLKERQAFAVNACDYIDAKLAEESPLIRDDQSSAIILSFSFVNTDLRDTFRSRFPNALWALVNTTETEANERIKKREGHFYKGAPPREDKDKAISEDSSGANSEWAFATVTFPHTILPGNDPVETNARRVVGMIQLERER